MHNETLVPLRDAAKLFPSSPSKNTLWRWASNGTRGRKLETMLCGGQRFTSTEAVARFCSFDPLNPTEVSPQPTRQRVDAAQAAEDELIAAGL